MSKTMITADDLRQFTGTEVHYRHNLNRKVRYTDGAQYLAEHAGAYWLLDEIALAQQFNAAVRGEEFQCWKLTVTGSKATLTCDDGDGHMLTSKDIDFTDFPLPEINLWVENGVILLPSEH